jgi:hypothetical protein
VSAPTIFNTIKAFSEEGLEAIPHFKTPMEPRLDAAERERRQAALDYARASVERKGFKISTGSRPAAIFSTSRATSA